jgi:hypothetical protein
VIAKAAELLREHAQLKEDLRTVKGEMIGLAVRLGLDQATALQNNNAEMFLDGWLVGKGQIQAHRVG